LSLHRVSTVALRIDRADETFLPKALVKDKEDIALRVFERNESGKREVV
jgi:hypothetical protein